jgi:photosystem II stability/assembly factor-like uncharacterized protein
MPAVIIRKLSLSCLLCLSWFSQADAADAPEPASIQRFIAVDNVCSWPNLTQLRDGTIVSIIHNRPSHGQMEGDVECWASKGGALWEKRGNPALNKPDTVRMNVAAGLAGNGDLIVLCSGWTNEKQPERPKQAAFRDGILNVQVCRSSDGGRTWTRRAEFPDNKPGWSPFIPFGDIVPAPDGSVRVSCYAGKLKEPAKSYKTAGWESTYFRSDDDGWTWKKVSTIGPKHNETTILHLDGRSWMAANRIDAMELYRSDDDGATWQGPQRVTGRNEINGHLLRLKDGRLLLSYGNRVAVGQWGVLAKFSADEGKTWSKPVRLIHSLERDCGYPSSVQRADGKIVTAYYSKSVAGHNRYHMGVALWEAPAQ